MRLRNTRPLRFGGMLGAGAAIAICGVALAGVAGTYSGTTNQTSRGRPNRIGLTASATQVQGIIYSANYTGGTACASLDGQPNRARQALTIKNGKFSGTVHPYAKDTLKISGTFDGNSVSGVFNETFTPANSSATCKSGNVTYSATK